MINVLVLSCIPSIDTGKQMIQDFCNGSIDKQEHIEYKNGLLVPVYSKNMSLVTYPANDTRTKRNTDISFFDFSGIDLNPLQDIPEVIQMYDVFEVLLIANLDHIYQSEIRHYLCPFYSQKEQVSERVSQFAKVITDNVDDIRIRCWAVLTSSQNDVTSTPRLVTDALRYHNPLQNGFCESQVYECYTPEKRKESLGILKATWDFDAYQRSIKRDEIHYK